MLVVGQGVWVAETRLSELDEWRSLNPMNRCLANYGHEACRTGPNTHGHHGQWTHFNFGASASSLREVFRTHVITCFFDDAFGLKNLSEVGEDMVTWECDYPLSDTTFEEQPGNRWKTCSGAGRSSRAAHLNTPRQFSFDLFAVHGRQADCTVGALRGKATQMSTPVRRRTWAASGRPWTTRRLVGRDQQNARADRLPAPSAAPAVGASQTSGSKTGTSSSPCGSNRTRTGIPISTAPGAQFTMLVAMRKSSCSGSCTMAMT